MSRHKQLKPVMCASFEGYNIWPLSRLKWIIRCGICDVDFRARVEVVDNPRVVCTNCGQVNIVPVEPA